MSSKPAECSRTCATVIGASLAQRFRITSSGASLAIGASSATRPFSASMTSASATKLLVIEPTRNSVSPVTGRPAATSASPTPPAHRVRSPSTSAMPAPGTCSRSITAATRARNASRSSGGGSARAATGTQTRLARMPTTRAIPTLMGGSLALSPASLVELPQDLHHAAAGELALVAPDDAALGVEEESGRRDADLAERRLAGDQAWRRKQHHPVDAAGVGPGAD